MKAELDKLIEAVLATRNIQERAVGHQVSQASTDKQKTLKLPKFALSDKWGSPDSDDRKTIEMFTKQISGTTIGEKITAINNFVTDCDDSCIATKEVTEIISNLIILDTLSSLISDYNPQTGGFLMEGFLAGLLGGKAETAPAVQGKIEDIYNYEGQPLSVKFLSPNTKITGSQKYILRYLNKYKKPLKYLLIQKQKEGADILGLQFWTFTVGHPEAGIEGDFDLTDFPIDQEDVTDGGLGTKIATLDFGSKEQLKNIGNKYVDRLGDRIVNIFDLLDKVINFTNEYMITANKSAGQKAGKSAEALKVKINEEF